MKSKPKITISRVFIIPSSNSEFQGGFQDFRWQTHTITGPPGSGLYNADLTSSWDDGSNGFWNTNLIDYSTMPSGFYTFKVEDNQGNVFSFSDYFEKMPLLAIPAPTNLFEGAEIASRMSPYVFTILLIGFGLWCFWDGWLTSDPDMLEHATFNKVLSAILLPWGVYDFLKIRNRRKNKKQSEN